jgi:hypothetical protein
MTPSSVSMGSDVGIVLEREVMLCFVSDWLCSARLTCGLPLGLFPPISRTFLTLDVLCHVLYHVSCHVLVMCGVAPFCDVLRCSNTSIGVVGFVTRSRIREEL